MNFHANHFLPSTAKPTIPKPVSPTPFWVVSITRIGLGVFYTSNSTYQFDGLEDNTLHLIIPAPTLHPPSFQNYLNLPNPTSLSVLIINPSMEFIGTRQQSRFWWVKVASAFAAFGPLPGGRHEPQTPNGACSKRTKSLGLSSYDFRVFRV